MEFPPEKYLENTTKSKIKENKKMEKYIEIAKKHNFNFITVDQNGYVLAFINRPTFTEESGWTNEDGEYLFLGKDESVEVKTITEVK